LAPVAGSSTSSDPPAALRHSVPNTRPSQVFSIKNLGAGTFIAFSPCGLFYLAHGFMADAAP
jgi:hypothetical protein